MKSEKQFPLDCGISPCYSANLSEDLLKDPIETEIIDICHTQRLQEDNKDRN
jgi:hypothetical protein